MWLVREFEHSPPSSENSGRCGLPLFFPTLLRGVVRIYADPHTVLADRNPVLFIRANDV